MHPLVTPCGSVSALQRNWVDDSQFEQAIEEVFEVGRSDASGSIFTGVDANCNVDNADDQRGSLVRDLCNRQGLLPLSQRNWTLLWQSPEGILSKKKVDFIFTNQSTACASIAENMHSG